MTLFKVDLDISLELRDFSNFDMIDDDSIPINIVALSETTKEEEIGYGNKYENSRIINVFRHASNYKHFKNTSTESGELRHEICMVINRMGFDLLIESLSF